jgi:hypothetical protein
VTEVATSKQPNIGITVLPSKAPDEPNLHKKRITNKCISNPMRTTLREKQDDHGLSAKRHLGGVAGSRIWDV